MEENVLQSSVTIAIGSIYNFAKPAVLGEHFVAFEEAEDGLFHAVKVTVHESG